MDPSPGSAKTFCKALRSPTPQTFFDTGICRAWDLFSHMQGQPEAMVSLTSSASQCDTTLPIVSRLSPRPSDASLGPYLP